MLKVFDMKLGFYSIRKIRYILQGRSQGHFERLLVALMSSVNHFNFELVCVFISIYHGSNCGQE